MEDNSIHGWSVSQCTSKDFKAGVTCSVQRPNQFWHVTVKEFQCGDNVYCGVVLDVIQPATELQSFRTMVSLINKIDVNKTIRIDQFVKYAHGSVRFSVPRLILLKCCQSISSFRVWAGVSYIFTSSSTCLQPSTANS
ncbi:uncharacterized protein LOC130718109 isoform X2 [Lotus japonicus]|nr:uncharacterized protein LOC130718109 isoform X2 [Lotus japonicus]